MKKIYLLVVSAIFCFDANAQYFQSEYGTPDDDHLKSGINTVTQGLGHFMAGEIFDPVTFSTTIAATFTDVNGAIPGAPQFNNQFTIFSPITGVVYNVRNPQVFEMDNGQGFGIVGVYQDPSSPLMDGIFYLQLDNMGNPTGVRSYNPLPGAFTWFVNSVGGICEAIGGNELYITGGVQANAPLVHVYALKIDVNTGGILWSQIYDINQNATVAREAGTDIIESPYQPLNVPEVVVVGFEHDNTGIGSNDGFTLRIDANTGNLTFPWAVLFGSATSNDAFHSITVSNSGTGGNVGFIIAGRTNYNGSYDYWMVKVDPTCGSSLWATLHDYSINPGADDHCFDVIERLNSSSQYEYYMAGYTSQGAFGGEDVLVIKTDDWGNGIANGEFTYGGGGNDRGTRLDQYNGTGADGLSTFGMADLGGVGALDMYLVKSYFDGQSGCNEIFSNPNPTGGPGLYSETPVTQYTGFFDDLLDVSPATISDAQLCYSTTIPGASNARVAPSEPKGEKEAIVSPNPMAQGNPVAMVELEAQTDITVQVAIYDMLGKKYYNGGFTLVKGKNQLSVDISNVNMAAGMYTVKISGATINKNILLMIK